MSKGAKNVQEQAYEQLEVCGEMTVAQIIVEMDWRGCRESIADAMDRLRRVGRVESRENPLCREKLYRVARAPIKHQPKPVPGQLEQCLGWIGASDEQWIKWRSPFFVDGIASVCVNTCAHVRPEQTQIEAVE